VSRQLGLFALDLGAESGRAILGQFDGQRLALSEIHRFPNGPVRLPDGGGTGYRLHWDVLRLWTEIKRGLALAVREPIDRLREMEVGSDYTGRLALLEELKALPFGAVWDAYCLQQSVPVGIGYLQEIQSYEEQELSRRV
jgi:hypothetical protein